MPKNTTEELDFAKPELINALKKTIESGIEVCDKVLRKV